MTLFDLLALIAATAAGLALVRICKSGLASMTLASAPGALARSRVTADVTYASCLLGPWSVALLALHLRGPRASLRRVARGPGFVACAAATAAIALYSAECAIQFGFGKLTLNPASMWRITRSFAHYAPLMIEGAWLCLALGKRWFTETSWVGWARRGLGIGWIGVQVFEFLSNLV
jgi:hypothetical protein